MLLALLVGVGVVVGGVGGVGGVGVGSLGCVGVGNLGCVVSVSFVSVALVVRSKDWSSVRSFQRWSVRLSVRPSVLSLQTSFVRSKQ